MVPPVVTTATSTAVTEHEHLHLLSCRKHAFDRSQIPVGEVEVGSRAVSGNCKTLNRIRTHSNRRFRRSAKIAADGGRTPIEIEFSGHSEGHCDAGCGEDHVPACVEDLVQWMSDRQKDLQEAMVSGRIQDVPRLAKLVADGGAQLKAWTAEDQSAVT